MTGYLPGKIAFALVLALVLGSFAAVLAAAGGLGGLTAADWAAVRFTLMQAALSSLISVALAIPVARALARRRFAGRSLLITALGAPFILPVIVAVMGLLSAFGRAGLVARGLEAVGLHLPSVYGPQGVVLAHVFLNLPFAVRMILGGWSAVPAERFRLAAALGFGPREVWQRIEWPMLRTVLPGAALAIFLICLTSFAVALIMGGGPRATTIELGIYQAFRLEFDLRHAASLAILQGALSITAAAASLAVLAPPALGAGLDRTVERWDAQGPASRLGDTLLLALTTAFLVLPVALVVVEGVSGLWGLPASVWGAALRSVAVALGAAFLAGGLALSLGLWLVGMRGPGSAIIDGAVMVSLTLSPLVLGTGLFLVLRVFADPVRWALVVTTGVNALAALPFALRLILPGLHDIRASYGRLAQSLDLAGWPALRFLVLPRLRRPLWFAMALSAAFSMGDLGVVTLFADPDRATLPMKIYGLMAAYRTNQAAAAAVLLMMLSFGLFWLLDRRGRHDLDAG